MFSSDEIRLILVIACLLLIPGWAFLAVTGLWRRWPGLIRWIVATAIGIAFYPALFYGSRIILPDFQLGFNKLIFLLASLLAITLWRLRKVWKDQFAFSNLEWVAIGIFAATLFTRLWIAHLRPLPAWSNSLHHTLLTQLTAINGRLPYTLAPYEPVSLAMYHLGLYSLTGSLQILSQVPAYTALLWMVQTLNGLCGLGVYLVLDRLVSRKAALVGSVVVGLLSFQPSWYVNWGRDTQISSQTILLIGWWITWEAIRSWGKLEKQNRVELFGLTIAAGLVTASIFLLHFRVAGFYIPLLALAVLWELFQGYRRRSLKSTLTGIAVIAGISLFLVFPALVAALKAFVHGVNQITDSSAYADSSFFQFSFESIFAFGVKPWLFWFAAVCGVFLLFRRNKLGILVLLWLGFLWLEGNTFLLKIPLLTFTNYGAVIMMYYLPLGLLIGAGIEELIQFIPILRNSMWISQAGLVVLLLAGLGASYLRISEIEPYRYFAAPEDVTAMNWINQNTPADALFAINTYNWMGTSPHGTDGGYWIPYFTGRKTTTGSMLNGLGSTEYIEKTVALATLVKKFEATPGPVEALCTAGIQYVYLGEKRGNFIGPGILAENLLGALKVYDQQGVQIFKVCP